MSVKTHPRLILGGIEQAPSIKRSEIIEHHPREATPPARKMIWIS